MPTFFEIQLGLHFFLAPEGATAQQRDRNPVGYLRIQAHSFQISAGPGHVSHQAAGAGQILSEFFTEKWFRHRISYYLLFNVFFLNGSISSPHR